MCGAEFLPNCVRMPQFLVIQMVARGCGKDKAGVEPSLESLPASQVPRSECRETVRAAVSGRRKGNPVLVNLLANEAH